jgi:hypothetical protein
LRHPHQTAASERIEGSLSEAAEASHGPPAAGDDDLASPLHSLQILAEAVMELTDTDFPLGLM